MKYYIMFLLTELLLSCTVLPNEPEIIDSHLKYGKTNVIYSDFTGSWEHDKPGYTYETYEFYSYSSGRYVYYEYENNLRVWKLTKHLAFDFNQDTITIQQLDGSKYVNYSYQISDNWFLLNEKLFTRVLK